MKTIVTISDTHGNFSAIDKILPIINENDFCFHLGDFERDILAYGKDIKSKVYSVKGNCDGGGEDQILQVENVKVLLTHGDRYNVKISLYSLFLRAKELDVNLVFYGHTHNAEIIEQEGIYLVNPGAMNKYGQSSYAYTVIHDQKIVCKIVNF